MNMAPDRGISETTKEFGIGGNDRLTLLTESEPEVTEAFRAGFKVARVVINTAAQDVSQPPRRTTSIIQPIDQFLPAPRSSFLGFESG
jgi:hypothetical protein